MASSLPDDYDPASVEEGWGKMPPELLELIFAHLEAFELYYPVSHTCHLWRQVVLRHTHFAGAYHRFRLDHPLPLKEPEVDWVASWEDEGFFVGSIPPGFEWANFRDAFGEDDFDPLPAPEEVISRDYEWAFIEESGFAELFAFRVDQREQRGHGFRFEAEDLTPHNLTVTFYWCLSYISCRFSTLNDSLGDIVHHWMFSEVEAGLRGLFEALVKSEAEVASDRRMFTLVMDETNKFVIVTAYICASSVRLDRTREVLRLLSSGRGILSREVSEFLYCVAGILLQLVRKLILSPLAHGLLGISLYQSERACDRVRNNISTPRSLDGHDELGPQEFVDTWRSQTRGWPNPFKIHSIPEDDLGLVVYSSGWERPLKRFYKLTPFLPLFFGVRPPCPVCGRWCCSPSPLSYSGVVKFSHSRRSCPFEDMYEVE